MTILRDGSVTQTHYERAVFTIVGGYMSKAIHSSLYGPVVQSVLEAVSGNTRLCILTYLQVPFGKAGRGCCRRKAQAGKITYDPLLGCRGTESKCFFW